MASNGGAIPKRPKSAARAEAKEKTKSDEGTKKRGKSKSLSRRAKADEKEGSAKKSGGASPSAAASASPPGDWEECGKCKKSPPVEAVLTWCLCTVCSLCIDVENYQSVCSKCKLVTGLRTPLMPDFMMRRKDVDPTTLTLRRHKCTICLTGPKSLKREAYSLCDTCSHYLCSECHTSHQKFYKREFPLYFPYRNSCNSVTFYVHT